MTTKKAPPRAEPKMKAVRKTDTDMVSATRSQTASMQKSADWPSATAVQTSATSWNKIADAIEANAKTMSDLLSQYRAAVAKQRVYRRQWSAAQRQVVTDVATTCDGSAEKVQGFGFDLSERTMIAVLAAPGNLVSTAGTLSGEAVVTWDKGPAIHGFIVQHATDPANPATYSSSIPTTKPKCTVSGLAPGAVVHVRVAAIDPRSSTGQSPWSAWIAATAR